MPKKQKPFVMLHHEVIDSPTFNNLSYGARWLYLVMKRTVFKKLGERKINTDPNQVWFGPSDIPSMNKNTYHRCIKQLRITGFIKIVKQGMFSPKSKTLYEFSNKWKNYEKG